MLESIKCYLSWVSNIHKYSQEYEYCYYQHSSDDHPDNIFTPKI